MSVVEMVTNPRQWISNMSQQIGGPPLIYLAHPVAPAPGEALATCSECHAQRLYGPGGGVDLRHLCNHDAPVTNTCEPASIVAFNLQRSLRWWVWLSQLEDAAIIMPWWVNVTGHGNCEDLRTRGLRDCQAIVRRSDALVLCGNRVSSGMRHEAEAAIETGGVVTIFQVASGGAGEPPPFDPAAVPWRRWLP